MTELTSAPAKRVTARKNRAAGKVQRRGGRLTETRREEIVSLVAPLFVERGYEHVTIDDIVERIGGSKRTLYDHFGGKAGLFEAVITDYCASVQRDLFAAVDQDASLEKQLVAIGTRFLSLLLQRRIIEQHRLMVSMGRSFPDVARLFYKLGPRSAYSLVAGWVERHQKAGKIGPGDSIILAELFLDMLTGKHQLAALTSSSDETSPAAVARTVKAAVKIFLKGVEA